MQSLWRFFNSAKIQPSALSSLSVAQEAATIPVNDGLGVFQNKLSELSKHFANELTAWLDLRAQVAASSNVLIIAPALEKVSTSIVNIKAVLLRFFKHMSGLVNPADSLKHLIDNEIGPIVHEHLLTITKSSQELKIASDQNIWIIKLKICNLSIETLTALISLCDEIDLEIKHSLQIEKLSEEVVISLLQMIIQVITGFNLPEANFSLVSEYRHFLDARISPAEQTFYLLSSDEAALHAAKTLVETIGSNINATNDEKAAKVSLAL